MKLLSLLFVFISNTAFANPLACSLCTFAIASGLGLAKYLGVDDTVVGVWVGAALLAMSQWTVYFLEKKKWKNKITVALTYILWYVIIIPLYLGKNPNIIFNQRTILFIDSFLFSVLCGSLSLFVGVELYRYMKEKNGKPHFPFEKVVLPIVLITLVSCIFYLITR